MPTARTRWGLLGALAVLGCHRDPPLPTEGPEGALARLHGALVRNDPSAAYDPLRVPRAELVARMKRLQMLQESDPQSVTEAGWQHLLADLDAAHPAAQTRAALEAVRPRLGSGRCARVSAAEAPEALVRVAEAVEGWPPVARSLRDDLAAMAPRTTAGVYRCERGSALRVVVGPRSPRDATPVVLSLE